MAIETDALATSAASGTSWQLNITIAADANLVTLALHWENDPGIITGVTCGAAAMSLPTNGEVASGGTISKLYHLFNPPTGTQTITVSLSTSKAGFLCARSYKGTDTAVEPRCFINSADPATSLTATATGNSDGSMFHVSGGGNTATPADMGVVGTGVSLLYNDASGTVSSGIAVGEKGPVAGTANQALGISNANNRSIVVILAELLAQAAPAYTQTDFRVYNDDGLGGLGEAA